MFVRLCHNRGINGAWCGFFIPTQAVMTEYAWTWLNADVEKHEREGCPYA